MGSNVSVDKSPESAMKFRFSIRSKSRKGSIPTPTKEKPINGKNPIAQFQDLGSKEETFFDSQGWLESDCEEDFLSVNGDITPSRGSSSNHRSSFTGSPRLSNTDRASNFKLDQSSPADKKKKLSELLLETFEDNNFPNDPKIANGDADNKPTNLDLPPRPSNGTPYLSKSNSIHSSTEKTPNRYSKPPKVKSASATKCCMPSLVTSLSSNERKKRLSPGSSFRE